MVTPRRLLALLVCLVLSLLGLVWFFKDTDWAKLTEALRRGNYLYLIPPLILTLLTYGLRAYRWQILMNPIKRVRWIHLLSATTIGFMANCVLPARVGEIVRATAIGLKENMSPATALTTVIVERIFDLLAIGVFVFIVLILIPDDGPSPAPAPSSAQAQTAAPQVAGPAASAETAPRTFRVRDLRKWGYAVGGVTVGCFVFIFLVKLFPSFALSVGRAPLRLLPQALADRGARILMALIVGLESLQSVTQIFVLAALSVLHWGLQVLGNMALGYCFGLQLGFAEASLIFVITALAVALPQGPGFVGVFDYATLVAMQLIGVGLATAQSYAIALHFIAVVPVTLVGFAFLWWEGLSFRQVTTARTTS